MICLYDNELALMKREKHPSMSINTHLREASPVDDFYVVEEEITYPDGSKSKVKSYRDPIYELFNQQRISRIGSTGLEQWIKSMMVINSNPLSELREKCSDSELLSIMKSRYCQTPSEVMNWARYLNSNLSELEKEVSLARERQKELEVASFTESANVVAADGATAQTTT